MKKVLVAGAGGFIGGFLVKDLLSKGYEVRAVDIKPVTEWYQAFSGAENIQLDMKDLGMCRYAVTKNHGLVGNWKDNGVDEVYNLAADMGGMGFIETHKAECMLSVLINTHLILAAKEAGVKKFFYASSACVYAHDKQTTTDIVALKEADAYPAMAEDGYGWEKLFSERMCRHFMEDYGIQVRVARFHNVYGPKGTYEGGREKAPAAICRKVIAAKLSGNHNIEIWGDGEQTRSFMYVDDCVLGINKLMDSDFSQPINLGREDLISINQLVDTVEDIAGIKLKRSYKLDAPKGVRGRNSDNTLIKQVLGWEPSITMREGLEKTYAWIYDQMTNGKK
jgi:nucleoside-diphosphate-sugar epimerase